ncbi:MAG: hypothetical protein ACRD26_04125, partial [Vicinamibacterales bacterium]
MRVLRFLRPVRASAAALQAETSPEDLGPDAFATEAPRQTAPEASQVTMDRLRMAVIALAVVVALQAVPAFLWVQSRLMPVEPIVTVAAAPAASTPPPASIEATPPCAAEPASQAALAAAARPAESAPA